MRSHELSEAAQVPQVFEVGARAELARDGDLCWIVSREADGVWWGWAPSGEEVRVIEVASIPSDFLRVIAPAPRAEQRWESATSVVRITARDAGMAVATARWLLEHGYTYAGLATAAPASIRASEATPASEPAPSTPAPWTVADARRLILDAVRAAEPRHLAAFTSAMCAMAESRAPGERLIRATSAALCAGEERLPERGQIAPWQKELAARAMRETLESAYGRGNVPLLCVDACARYLDRRAAR